MKTYSTKPGTTHHPPLIRANQLTPIIELVQSLALPWENILTRSKLPVDISDKPNALISEASVWDVMLQAGEMIDVENIGFYLGQNIPSLPQLSFDPESKTVLDALTSFCNAMHLNASNTHFSLKPTSNGAWLCRSDSLKVPGSTVLLEQYITAVFIRIIQSLLDDKQWQPSRVRFCFVGPENLEGFSASDSQIEFDQPYSAIFIDQQTLATVPNKEYLKANPLLKKMDNLDEVDVIHGIEKLFCTYLNSEVIHEDFVSSALLSSPRKLQRELENKGTSFRQLRNSLLFREAKIMLADKNKSISEIARTLGYSVAANFTRAFTNWAGCTPTQYRDSLNEKKPVEKGCNT